jgi:hypothetical protein
MLEVAKICMAYGFRELGATGNGDAGLFVAGDGVITGIGVPVGEAVSDCVPEPLLSFATAAFCSGVTGGLGLAAGVVRIKPTRQTIVAPMAKRTMPGSFRISLRPVMGGVARSDCTVAGAIKAANPAWIASKPSERLGDFSGDSGVREDFFTSSAGRPERGSLSSLTSIKSTCAILARSSSLIIMLSSRAKRSIIRQSIRRSEVCDSLIFSCYSEFMN